MITQIIKKSQKKLMNCMNDLALFERDLNRCIAKESDFLEVYSTVKNLHDSLNDIRAELKDLEKHIKMESIEVINV